MKHRAAITPSACRSCGAAILWATWPKSGRRMPVDAEAAPDGDVLLVFRRAENVLEASKASELSEVLLPGRRRFKSHFATCIHASDHRRPHG